MEGERVTAPRTPAEAGIASGGSGNLCMVITMVADPINLMIDAREDLSGLIGAACRAPKWLGARRVVSGASWGARLFRSRSCRRTGRRAATSRPVLILARPAAG